MTIRSTAGLGYEFEDQIGAWLLLKMLSGEPLPDMENAPGIRLQTQTAGLGWKIDDDLVRFIRHLLVIPTDFDRLPSKDEAAAIAACRKLLVSSKLEEGSELWKALNKATNRACLELPCEPARKKLA